MANPVITTLTNWVWVKVATNVKAGIINKKSTDFQYYQTYRLTGDTAPTAITLKELPIEAIKMFEDSEREPIDYSEGVDIYILSFHLDNRTASAKVRVDASFSRGSIDVNVQDQSSELISLYLGEVLDYITVIANTAKHDTTVDIETTGITPLVGDFVCLQEDGKITQNEVTSVTGISGNQYTLGMSIPLDYPYSTASGCSLLDVDMDKNGSVTPIEFQIQPKPGTRWDITRMMTAMVLSSAGDDGLFGNLAAVSNGVYFRKEDSLDSNNLFNCKDNSDFRVEGYDVAYPTRSGGGGSYGMASRITFSGQSKQGVVIRLSGDSGDQFVATVRDDLTGLAKYRTKIQGHVVVD